MCRVCRAREGEEWEKGKGGVELGRGKWNMGGMVEGVEGLGDGWKGEGGCGGEGKVWRVFEGMRKGRRGMGGQGKMTYRVISGWRTRAQ